MTDTVDTATRSRMMAAVGGKNTRPEMTLRRALHADRFRFRLHDRRLPGSPDLVLPRYRSAIFVHGCFWHQHKGCRFATQPKDRSDFWSAKFDANAARDARKEEALHQAGWKVAIVWECAMRKGRFEKTLMELERWLRFPSVRFETLPQE
ncbi:very short patch repair endonuclease [Mesorhizobium carmichaelinearum]|uniref:very short patch repair endonuclease n=1 Tax=Mesorhizobium carmichaelinearum TaxID=1208188 RepID=UPI000BA31931|nr:DNA mismatch endonuclease Vsr [Mesorhizobium carmichaelinearum]